MSQYEAFGGGEMSSFYSKETGMRVCMYSIEELFVMSHYTYVCVVQSWRVCVLCYVRETVFL